MKFNLPINNFASGEWSPKMMARTETDQYARAAQSLKNNIPQMQGGAFRRPGTAYIDLGSELAYVDGTTKMIPVTLASRFRYVLFATTDAPSGTNKWFVYSLQDGSRSVVSASSGADFADALVDEAQFQQIDDTIFIASSGAPLRYLQLVGSTWTLKVHYEYFTDVAQEWRAYPFGPIQTLGIAGTITATGTFTVGGVVTLTSSLDQFNALMVAASGGGLGCLFKFTSSSSTGVVKVTAVTNSKTATATVMSALPGSSPTTYGTAAGTAWEKALWNGFDGFPRAITSYQGRLYTGGASTSPSTVWGSRIGNVFNFMEVPLAQEPEYTTFGDDNSRPFSLKPTAAEGSNIQGLSASKTLVINTQRAEIVAFGTQGALGPNDFDFESSTSFGSEHVQPVRVNNFLTYVQRGGRRLRDIIFSFDESQYKSADLSFVADHLLPQLDYIKEMCSAEVGSSVLFTRTNQGKVNIVTLDRDYQVNAWAPFEFGGTFTGNLYGTYTSCVGICSVVGAQGTNDAVFFLLRRTINGSTVTYFEQLMPFFEYDTISTVSSIVPVYVDSAKIVSQASSVTVSGLTHLAGQSVSVLADGLYVGEKTVSVGGVVTLSVAATYIVVGLQYTSVVRPTYIEQNGGGSSVGRDKRVNDVYYRFYNSKGAKYGLITGTQYSVTMTTSSALVMFTGDQLMKFPPGYSRSNSMQVTSNSPFPCNVIGIVLDGMAYD